MSKKTKATKNPGGRPRRVAAGASMCRLQVSCTADELAAWHGAAEAAGVSLSDMVRAHLGKQARKAGLS